MRGVQAAAAVAAVALVTGGWLALRPAAHVTDRAARPVALVTPSPTPPPSPASAPTTAAPRPAPARPDTRVLGPVPPAPPRTGCPPPVRPPSGGVPPPLGPPKVAEAALPAPVRVIGKAASLSVVRGKGLWVTPFEKSSVDVSGLVALAHRLGVRSLWVRTGGTYQGYYGGRFLPRLVPAAHAAGLGVVAWDFPTLSDPVSDAQRARAAFAGGVDAFSPDVETSAERVYPTPRRLALYLSLVRRAAGSRPVVATVPRPSPQRQSFPYRSFVPYADAFAPMVYWSCNEPGALVAQSLAQLGRLLPVAPVGQAYDMGPEGGRVGVPSRAETLRFLDASRRGGAIGASLWTVEHAGRAQLTALGDYWWPVTAR